MTLKNVKINPTPVIQSLAQPNGKYWEDFVIKAWQLEDSGRGFQAKLLGQPCGFSPAGCSTRTGACLGEGGAVIARLTALLFFTTIANGLQIMKSSYI